MTPLRYLFVLSFVSIFCPWVAITSAVFAQSGNPFNWQPAPDIPNLRLDFNYPLRMSVRYNASARNFANPYFWFEDQPPGHVWTEQDVYRSFNVGHIEITRDHTIIFKPVPSPVDKYLARRFELMNRPGSFFLSLYSKHYPCDRAGAPPCHAVRGDPKFAATLIGWLELEGFEVTEIDELK